MQRGRGRAEGFAALGPVSGKKCGLMKPNEG